jgi:hypothetical protein
LRVGDLPVPRVVFVHINESAAPGCEYLAMLLKGKLPVHDCGVLCCY